MKSRLLALLALSGVCWGAGCDALLTDPAPATSDVSVSFAVDGVDAAGLAAAFDKVNRVFLRLSRPDGLSRDTVVRVTPRSGEIRARLILETKERVSALGVLAQLWAGNAALFQGERVIRVEVGTPTSVVVPLTVVVSRIHADRRTLSLSVGDTVRLSAALLFATGDTIAGGAGAWTSENTDVLFVTQAGLAAGRKPGDARLVVRYQDFADTVLARVVAR